MLKIQKAIDVKIKKDFAKENQGENLQKMIIFIINIAIIVKEVLIDIEAIVVKHILKTI